MGTGLYVAARKPLRYRLLRMAAWLLLLAAVLAAALWVAVHRCTRPWPARVPVRPEPSRPFLADADVRPDNPFFYLRQLAGIRELNPGWQPPAPPPPPPAPPKDEMEAMFPDPTAVERAQAALSPTDELSRWLGNGYAPGAYPPIYAPNGQGWRLYSVGPDQIDHGGRFNAFQPQPRMPPDQTDLCFHSDEFAPPPAPTE